MASKRKRHGSTRRARAKYTLALCLLSPAWQEHWAKQQVHDFEHRAIRLMIEEVRLSASMEAERDV
jgi:hypothetical protein